MFVPVEIVCTPGVIPIAQAVFESKRIREQITGLINTNKLDFSVVFSDDISNTQGLKCVVTNEKWDAFLQRCKEIDSEKAADNEVE